MVQILFFFDPVRFRGHFEEICIAKVLLKTKPRCVGKLIFRRLRKCGERKKKKINSPQNNYNGSLALATLERATIIKPTALITAGG